MSKGMSKRGQDTSVHSYMLFNPRNFSLPQFGYSLSSLKVDPITEHGFSWPASPTVDGYVNAFTKLHVLIT